VEAGRLRRLAIQHLHMEPIQPDQLGTLASLRDDAGEDEEDEAGDPAVHNQKLDGSPPVASPVSAPVSLTEDRP